MTTKSDEPAETERTNKRRASKTGKAPKAVAKG